MSFFNLIERYDNAKNLQIKTSRRSFRRITSNAYAYQKAGQNSFHSIIRRARWLLRNRFAGVFKREPPRNRLTNFTPFSALIVRIFYALKTEKPCERQFSTGFDLPQRKRQINKSTAQLYTTLCGLRPAIRSKKCTPQKSNSKTPCLMLA